MVTGDIIVLLVYAISASDTTKLNTIVQSLLLRRTKDQTCKKGKPIVSETLLASMALKVNSV